MSATIAIRRHHEADFESARTTITSNTPSIPVGNPVETAGDSAYFRPELMTTNKPYAFSFLGVPLAIIKRSDGSLDIYHLP